MLRNLSRYIFERSVFIQLSVQHPSVHMHVKLCLFGFSGATLACGTGACAVVVAAVLEGRAERVKSTLFI